MITISHLSSLLKRCHSVIKCLKQSVNQVSYNYTKTKHLRSEQLRYVSYGVVCQEKLRNRDRNTNFPYKENNFPYKENNFPYKESTAELISRGDDLIRGWLSNKLSDKRMEKIRNSLNKILYMFYIRRDVNLIPLFEKIQQHGIHNEATYSIIIRHYAELGDIANVRKIFQLLKEGLEIPIHCRSYIPVIKFLLRQENFEESRAYLKEMVEVMRPHFHENLFRDIINVCAEIRTRSNKDLTEQFVEEVFLLCEKLGGPHHLTKELVDAICTWFNSDRGKKWRVQKMLPGESGMCPYCEQRLKKRTISIDRLDKLKKNVFNLVSKGVESLNSGLASETDLKLKNKVFTRTKNREFYDIVTMEAAGKKSSVGNDTSRTGTCVQTLCESVLLKWKTYLDEQTRFDVVIDTLNVGNIKRGKFNPVLVRNTLEMFLQQNKRILVLCIGMKGKHFLPKLHPYLNRCRLISLEHGHDDYFLMYILAHHNFNIKLVSNDLFCDHVSLLDLEDMLEFRRWQKGNQIKLGTEDAKPIFFVPTDFHVAMQKHDSGWHIPISDEAWYCVPKDM